MQVPKIQLSPAETELMQNADIILTKNRVLEKIKGLLQLVEQEQLSIIHNEKPDGAVFGVGPKISKGEQYAGLPYLILDYPRVSGPEGLFFIRHMFWWGNFFSSTLHVSGKYKQEIIDAVKTAYPLLD